eukprot:595258-Pyramimonas_sp.AAC.1
MLDFGVADHGIGGRHAPTDPDHEQFRGTQRPRHSAPGPAPPEGPMPEVAQLRPGKTTIRGPRAPGPDVRSPSDRRRDKTPPRRISIEPAENGQTAASCCRLHGGGAHAHVLEEFPITDSMNLSPARRPR